MPAGAFNHARGDCEHVALGDIDIDSVADLDTFYNLMDATPPSEFSVGALASSNTFFRIVLGRPADLKLFSRRAERFQVYVETLAVLNSLSSNGVLAGSDIDLDDSRLARLARQMDGP